MNESDSEESVKNWWVNFSCKNLKKKKLSTIIDLADKTTTQEQKKYDTLLAPAICKRLAVQWKIHSGKVF